MKESSISSNYNLFFTLGPFILGILVLNLNVDTFFATQLGSIDLATMGSVSLIGYLPETIILTVSYAIQSFTARKRNNARDKYSSLCSGIILTFIILIPCSLVLLSFPLQIISWITQDAPISNDTDTYFRLRVIGMLFKCLILCLRGFYASYEYNFLFFIVIAATVSFNFILNSFFVFGIYPFTKLGLTGIGLSYCLSMFLGLCIYMFYFSKELKKIRKNKNPLTPSSSETLGLIQFMLPLTAHNLLDHFGTIQIFILTEQVLDVTSVASMHLMGSILYLFPGMGFGLTALTLVSKAYGSKKLKQARKTGNYILYIGCLFLGGIGIILAVFTPWILEIIVPEQALRQVSIYPLQLMLLTIFLHIACQISMKCLQAINLVSSSVIINLSVIYGFRLPAMALLLFIKNPSLIHFQVILILERIIKLSSMQYLWHKKTETPKLVRKMANALI